MTRLVHRTTSEPVQWKMACRIGPGGAVTVEMPEWWLNTFAPVGRLYREAVKLHWRGRSRVPDTTDQVMNVANRTAV